MRDLRFLIATISLCAWIAMPCRSEDASPTSGREDQIKAGYLFNFAKFVEWPASVSNYALTVCFVGGEGVQRAFEKDLEGKRVGSRRLAVRTLSDLQAMDGCNVLYIDGKTAIPVYTSSGNASLPILTVGDTRDFTRNGGIISLYTENNRLRFVVNVQNALRAKLHISSSLLQLASVVEKGDSQ